MAWWMLSLKLIWWMDEPNQGGFKCNKTSRILINDSRFSCSTKRALRFGTFIGKQTKVQIIWQGWEQNNWKNLWSVRSHLLLLDILCLRCTRTRSFERWLLMIIFDSGWTCFYFPKYSILCNNFSLLLAIFTIPSRYQLSHLKISYVERRFYVLVHACVSCELGD